MPPAALTTLDTIALVLVLLFALRGAFKGFAWQALRTGGLVVALWAAFAFQQPVGQWIDAQVSFIPSPAAPWVAAVGIFVVLFLLATYVAWIARGALRQIRLGGADRLLGFALGGVMGLVLLTIGVFLWGQFAASDEQLKSALEGSYSARGVAWLSEAVKPYLSEDFVNRWSSILQALRQVGG